jgi:predicted transcriptional regulator
MASSTTSIRLPKDLKGLLESAAREMKRPKSSLIAEALAEYLQRHNRESFLAECRRQSIAAGKKKWKDEAIWDEAAAEVWDRE